MPDAPEYPLICPHCGQLFNAADPRVRRLPPATFHVWLELPERFKRGAVMGPSELGALIGMTRGGVRYHLHFLVRAGLVRRIPQAKAGHIPVRHVYAGIPQ